VYWTREPLLNIAGTMLVGVLVVIFAFDWRSPISALASTATRNSIGIALAVILMLSSPWITPPQGEMSASVGFCRWRNGLFFGAMSATYGMPMIVELGVALDVWWRCWCLVCSFSKFATIDSLDLKPLESLRRINNMEFVILLGAPLLGRCSGCVRGTRLGAGGQCRLFAGYVPRSLCLTSRIVAHGNLLVARGSSYIDAFNVFL